MKLNNLKTIKTACVILTAYLILWIGILLYGFFGETGSSYRAVVIVSSVAGVIDIVLSIKFISDVLHLYANVADEFSSNKVKLLEEQLHSNEERLNALQSQINPHFLYNTLDTIRSMALEKGEKEISDVINALSQMFKYSMDFANPIVPVSHEMGQVKRYMKLQQLRFPDRFIFEEVFKCTQDDLHNVYLPKYCVQPLIENAISHAFKGKRENCHLQIYYISLGNQFQIEVRDNGKGMEESDVESINKLLVSGGQYTMETRNGIALQNIYSRLKLYFGADISMYFQSTKGLGTIVTIAFPIKKHE